MRRVFDEDIPCIYTPTPTTHTHGDDTRTVSKEKTYHGPITRSRAKEIQSQVKANLSLFSDFNDLAVLPICSFIVLRYMEGEPMLAGSWKGKDMFVKEKERMALIFSHHACTIRTKSMEGPA